MLWVHVWIGLYLEASSKRHSPNVWKVSESKIRVKKRLGFQKGEQFPGKVRVKLRWKIVYDYDPLKKKSACVLGIIKSRKWSVSQNAKKKHTVKTRSEKVLELPLETRKLWIPLALSERKGVTEQEAQELEHMFASPGKLFKDTTK